MRALTLAALTGLLACGSTGQLEAQSTIRIGYINSEAIFQEAPGAAEANAEFQRQMDRFSQEVEQMGAELDSMMAAYQQQQSTLLPNVRQARENEIQQMQLRYQQRLEQMQQEAETNQRALLQPIIDEMNEVIEEIRVEGSYAIIHDVASQSIIAADPALDLTEEVLRRLEQRAQADPGTQ